ncbi:MAG: hypothetical protein ACRDHZ_00690, partial [Ktedonobacteraceae bacterium]
DCEIDAGCFASTHDNLAHPVGGQRRFALTDEKVGRIGVVALQGAEIAKLSPGELDVWKSKPVKPFKDE